MEPSRPTRRDVLVRGSAATAGLMLASPWFAHAFPRREGAQLVPFADQPPPTPAGAPVFNLQRWEDLDTWITPTDKFFRVAHYDQPQLEEKDWRLEVAGLVDRPRTYTLSGLRARPRAEVTFTLECAGNHGFPWFQSGIGTARWAGTPLAPILAEAGVRRGGIEVVFIGHDAGEETVRDIKMRQNFARSLSLEDAMSPANLVCYEMNGVALTPSHGFPARLVVPGSYGIANVKWLKRIEARETRFMGRFMGRDYVTVREERRGGESVFMETSVGRAQLKSAPARVTRKGSDYWIDGAAWGGAVARVDVRVDDGPWRPATIDRTNDAPYAWKIWTFEWPRPAPGEHAVTSRAVDTEGHVQPEATDPIIANKKTYWESFGQVTRKVRVA